MKKKFIIIQSKKELELYSLNENLKKYTPIIWYPFISTKKNINNGIVKFISDYKSKKIILDIDLMNGFYSALKHIDLSIHRNFPEISKINYYFKN